jgi:hypothetical protein
VDHEHKHEEPSREAEEVVDESGLEAKDIELVLTQTKVIIKSWYQFYPDILFYRQLELKRLKHSAITMVISKVYIFS